MTTNPPFNLLKPEPSNPNTVIAFDGSGDPELVTKSSLAGPTPVFSSEFVSSEQSIVLESRVVIAHGLGGLPKLLTGELVCKTAEFGYAVGDVYPIHNNVFSDGTPGASQQHGVALTMNSTNVEVLVGEQIQILEKTTPNDSMPNLTPANWRIVLRAYV